MRYITICCAAVLVLTIGAASAAAHHSFAAEYDSNKPITLTGKVTKVEWENPHTYFYIDVKDAKSNAVANWGSGIGKPEQSHAAGLDAEVDEDR